MREIEIQMIIVQTKNACFNSANYFLTLPEEMKISQNSNSKMRRNCIIILMPKGV